ncbi:MAG TPA: SGNH/GDSL hydrolase family protein [Nocardioides sp.]|jgi:lysophospholipase L1-like esterase
MRVRTLFAAVTTTVMTTLGLTAAPSEATPAIDYVALGDSYSAGSGILPLDPNAFLFCARTTLNYPHLIADAAGATSFQDVTCGGAQTKDYTTEQYAGLTPPQLDAVTEDTDLVTMTIGGNDTDLFIDLIADCAAAGLTTLGFGSPCKNHYGDSFDTRISSTIYPAVRQALRDVQAKAPHATVAILGYPWIMPATGGCYWAMPIATGDVPYMRAIQAHLNAAIGQAAADAGATYVDLGAASNGHDACQPIGTRWVEPALFGTNFVPVHPNALGESKMAAATLAALGLS